MTFCQYNAIINNDEKKTAQKMLERSYFKLEKIDLIVQWKNTFNSMSCEAQNLDLHAKLHANAFSSL